MHSLKHTLPTCARRTMLSTALLVDALPDSSLACDVWSLFQDVLLPFNILLVQCSALYTHGFSRMCNVGCHDGCLRVYRFTRRHYRNERGETEQVLQGTTTPSHRTLRVICLHCQSKIIPFRRHRFHHSSSPPLKHGLTTVMVRIALQKSSN